MRTVIVSDFLRFGQGTLTQRGDEDFSSSTEKVVQRIRDPDTE
jgi:hypothetical protein